MSKSIKTLIRLSRWEVDEKRRVLTELQNREDGIIAAMAEADQRMLVERQIASQDPTGAGSLFGAYAQAWMSRRETARGELASVREAIEVARDDLNDAFRRLKTFEITQKNQEKREQDEADRKEQANLDEIGLNIHRRKVRD